MAIEAEAIRTKHPQMIRKIIGESVAVLPKLYDAETSFSPSELEGMAMAYQQRQGETNVDLSD